MTHLLIKNNRNVMRTEYDTNKSLSDDEILLGFRRADGSVVKEYFYGYCRVAYCIYDKRYDLRHKPGMDFYSLAHEYYLALCMHDFRQLADRKPTMSLKTWMVNGFRFMLLDKLKEVEREHRCDSIESRLGRTRLGFDVADNGFAADFRNTINDICLTYFGRDTKNAIILQMLFIEGFKGKEVAAQLGMSASAVTQRYNRMMHDVVVPYFKRYFVADEYGTGGMADEAMADMQEACCRMAAPCACPGVPCDDGQPTSENIFMDMYKIREERVTPAWIDTLGENEVFVFGSNLAGMHGGGAARVARLRFGAVMGKGVGLQGQSYAIPTMQGGVDTIRPYVDEFIAFAKANPGKRFLVTPIGCGIAGFEPDDIAPLFAAAADVPNISLPESFWEVL